MDGFYLSFLDPFTTDLYYITTMVPVGETMAADASRVVTNSPLSQPLSASCNPLLPPPASLSYLIESLLNGLRRTSHRLVK